MREKIYKLFLAIMVSMSLLSGPIAQNEVRKVLEILSQTSYTQVREVDEEESEDFPYL
ncbi:hypothetical protein AALB51_16175 [Lachnospiraceae bacterium 62-26]